MLIAEMEQRLVNGAGVSLGMGCLPIKQPFERFGEILPWRRIFPGFGRQGDQGAGLLQKLAASLALIGLPSEERQQHGFSVPFRDGRRRL
jgi:hypothetical protein